MSLIGENVSGEVPDRVRARRGGALTDLDRLLLHSPPVADGWNALLGVIRSRTTVRPDVRELVICRIAALNGARYEWAAHAPLALASGASPAQLAAVREGSTGAFDAVQKAAIDYACAMTRDVEVSDETFDELRRHFDERGVVELTATVAAYNLVSRFLVALRLEPTAPREESPGARIQPSGPA